MQPNQTLCLTEVQRVLTARFAGDLRAKRVLSQANATLGVVRTASLAVYVIDQGLALPLARGLTTKHAIKQVDRMLSNEGIDVDAALRHWVPYVVGSRNSINVAMDWTDFDADGHATPTGVAMGDATGALPPCQGPRGIPRMACLHL